jgi:hypothetical protein
MEHAWKDCLQVLANRRIKALPLIICWGAWLARNSTIFNDRPSIPEIVLAQGLSILSHFPWEKDSPAVRIIQLEQIDYSKPWDFFYRASQNENQSCGGGAILFLSLQHSFKLKMGLGPGTNNYVELMAIKLLLLFAGEKGVQTIQIFGDSMIVINWIGKLNNAIIFCCNLFWKTFLDFWTHLNPLILNMSTWSGTE